MSPEAIKGLKTLLTQLKTKEDFYDKIRTATGMKVDQYLQYTQAIYAVRSIINLYDKSLYGELASRWDEKVVLQRYSDSINKYSDERGYNTVIKVIRELQKLGKWTVPPPTKKSNVNKVLSQEEETKSPDSEIKTLQKVEEPKAATSSPSFVSSDDGSYEILDFSNHKKVNTLDDYHIRVSLRKGNTYVALNTHITSQCKDFKDTYVYFRANTITKQLFLVVSPDEKPNSLHAKFRGKSTSNLYITNKKCVEYLMNRYNITKDVDEIKVTKNLSKVDNVVTIELG